MQNKIILKGLRLYAYHGVMEQERKVGANYIIDTEILTDFSLAMNTDDLNGTINYAAIFNTIQREMVIPSHLLEHVAGRIARTLLNNFPTIQSVHLRLLKENPPMGADCQGAGIELTLTATDL